MLLELLIFLIFPIFIYILLIKVILPGRDKWGNYFLVPQVLPRKIFKPRMLLNFCWTVLPQSVYWLSLYHLHMIKHVSHTLLIKSAASNDHPLGTSFFLICICFAKI